MMRSGLLVLMLVLSLRPAFAQTDSLTIFIERQDWGQAILLLNARLIERPGNADIRFKKAQVTAWSGDFRSAIVQLRALTSEYPEYTDAVILLARTHSWDGDYDAAETLYRRVQQSDPQYADALAGLAQVAFYRGDLTSAYVQTSSILNRYPTNDIAKLVRSSIQQGMKPESITSIIMPWDSDENRANLFSERLQFGWRPDVTAQMRFTAVNSLSGRFNTDEQAYAMLGGAQYQRYTALIGGTYYPSSSKMDLSYSMSARFTDIIFYSNRYGLFDTPSLIARHVSLTELGATHLLLRGAHTLVSTATLATISIGNQTATASLDYSWSRQSGDFTLTPGAASRFTTFLKDDPTGGIFAPKWWNTTTAKLISAYRPASSRFFAESTANLGLQTVAPYGAPISGPELSYAVDLRVGYAANQDLLIEAGYLYSTLLNTTTQAADQYWVQRLGITVTARF